MVRVSDDHPDAWQICSYCGDFIDEPFQGESLTGEYHTFVNYDPDERVLNVPIPEPKAADTANTPEEALVEREREQKLSPGERAVLAEGATAGTIERD